MTYQNKVVLVTGGAKGVGKGISECYLSAGAKVVVCGRSAPENAADLPQVGDSRAEFVPCDVRDLASCQALIDGIVAKYGRLDVLVNNAGGAPYTDAATASPRFHDKIFALNLTAPFALSQMANKVMQHKTAVASLCLSARFLRCAPRLELLLMVQPKPVCSASCNRWQWSGHQKCVWFRLAQAQCVPSKHICTLATRPA